MIGKLVGDKIEGEKIILEAGTIKLFRGIVRSQGHHGDRAVGKIRALAFIEKSFEHVKEKPIE